MTKQPSLQTMLQATSFDDFHSILTQARIPKKQRKKERKKHTYLNPFFRTRTHNVPHTCSNCSAYIKPDSPHIYDSNKIDHNIYCTYKCTLSHSKRSQCKIYSQSVFGPLPTQLTITSENLPEVLLEIGKRLPISPYRDEQTELINELRRQLNTKPIKSKVV